MAVEKELFAVTQPAKIQTTLQFESNKMVYVNPTTQKQVTTTSTLKRPISAISSSPVHSKSPAGRTSEPIAKAPKLSSSPVATQKYSVQKKRTPDAKTPTHSKSDSKSNEQDRVRVSARKSLIEQLLIRTKEITDPNVPRLTESEITEFVNAAEMELFEIFGGDTNMKYKSKYRSLMYNIKDRKNLTLFEKISSKAIEPRQLVRMSTEELASQELAKWRENETKHQLEMITKSELDMIACGNSYVLKTHKGEEVIQEERTIPVEELVSVLNNTSVSSSDAVIVTKDNRVDKYLSADGGKSSSSKSANKKDGERDKKDRHESRSSGSSSKHKRKRSRERHSSHSHSHKVTVHSHSHKDKSHDKDRKERSGSSGGGSSAGVDNRKEKKDHKSSSSSSSSSSSRGKHYIDKERKKDSTSKSIVNTPIKNQQTDESSIADKILKAQSTIDSILHPEEFKKIGDITTPTTTNVSSATEVSTQLLRQSSVTANESDQEPTSTVTIPSPPEITSETQSTTPSPSLEKSHASIVWSGSISMVDVATFQVSLSPLSGSTAMIEFPKEFDVVGRINPETVWEYLEKIRISKDIVLLKFSPRSSSEDNETAYSQFITYLDARKRLGVIKIPSKLVKDFYIMPLTSHRSLPSILKSTTGFDLGADRPDLLLGIIVRNRISAQSSHPPVPSKHRQSIPFIGHKSTTMTIPNSKDVHYTPPSSPNMNIPVQAISKQVIKSTFSSNLDDDEPYSPGGSDDDDLALSTIPNSYLSSTSAIANPIPDYTKPVIAPSLSSFDKQQLEELNRQIEAEKKEIAMHLQTVDIDEPYSPTSSVSPPIKQNLSNVVSNISIPANLADILKNVASFGSTTTTMNMPINQYGTSLMDDTEYVPMAPVTSSISYAPAASSQSTQPIAVTDVSSQPSKLAQLTDEELMRLVPDEID